MEQVTVKARLRAADELGKGPSRRIRAAGGVPGVAYGHGREPVALALDARDLAAVVHAGANVLVDLQVEGLSAEDGALAIVKELRKHPITDRYVSVDLQWISLTERISVNVPLVVEGTPAGLQEGGFLEHLVHDLEVRGIVTEIPDAIRVDVSHLGVNDSVHIRDLQLPPGLEVMAHPDEVVATVAVPRMAAEEEVAAEEAPAEGEEGAEEEGEEAPSDEESE
jgi:large subunit ribosomal protein L25